MMANQPRERTAFYGTRRATHARDVVAPLIGRPPFQPGDDRDVYLQPRPLWHRHPCTVVSEDVF